MQCCATLQARGTKLPSEVGVAVYQRLLHPETFETRKLAIVTRHHADPSLRPPNLLERVAPIVLQRIAELSKQDIANFAQSFAHLELRGPATTHAPWSSCAETERSLSLVAWACAKLTENSLPLLDAVALAAEHRKPETPSQHLVDLVWAFAVCAAKSAPLLAALSAEAELLLAPAERSAREAANTTWEFTTSVMENEALIAATHVAPHARREVAHPRRPLWADIHDEEPEAQELPRRKKSSPAPPLISWQDPDPEEFSEGSDWDAPQGSRQCQDAVEPSSRVWTSRKANPEAARDEVRGKRLI
ncbi:unnamed protein product [Effrenium voratum]|nr:unnamed protein product [Effrenium voratum]